MEQIKKVPFAQFLRYFQWRQGEHLSILGTTGAGKTFLSFKLLPKRRYITFLASKPQDKTISDYGKKNDYERISNWPPSPKSEKVLLWPKFKKPGDEVKQRSVFYTAMIEMFIQGGWTVYVDEVYYFSKMLHFDPILKIYWTQARSNNVTLVGATQRPRDVPLLMYDQAVHLFFFRFRDRRDLERLGDIGWVDSRQIKMTVANLAQYEFLYVNNISGDMIISKAE